MERLTSELGSKCYEYEISKKKLGYVDDLNEIYRDLAFFLGVGYGKISYSKINNREIAVVLRRSNNIASMEITTEIKKLERKFAKYLSLN